MNRRLRRALLTVVVVCVVLLLLAAVARFRPAGGEQERVQAVVELFCQALAGRNYDALLSVLTGDALAAMEYLLPVLEASGAETALHDLQVHVREIRRDTAVAEARYVQEQRVPGHGTTVQRMVVLFEFVLLEGQWRIARITRVR
ncbi:MAG TPA: hypothetical protein DEQ28_01940 [Clostridiales bacterium]|nr:hypothetical protein [Clostridiales bacterium]